MLYESRNDKMITSYLKKKNLVEYIFYMNCIDINYIYIKKIRCKFETFSELLFITIVKNQQLLWSPWNTSIYIDRVIEICLLNYSTMQNVYCPTLLLLNKFICSICCCMQNYFILFTCLMLLFTLSLSCTFMHVHIFFLVHIIYVLY